MDDDDDSVAGGWTGAGPRSPDRPPFRCPVCQGWLWWRLRQPLPPYENKWTCIACDPPDLGYDPKAVEMANTLRPKDAAPPPPPAPPKP